MTVEAWLKKLNSWGFKDALKHPKTTVGFFVAYVVIRWVVIALAIAMAAFVWLIVSIIAGAIKGR